MSKSNEPEKVEGPPELGATPGVTPRKSHLESFVTLLIPFKTSIQGKAPWLKHWDRTIAIFKFFNIILAPLVMAWPEIFKSELFIAYFTLFDLIFLADLLVHSWKVRHDDYGREILNPYINMTKYFKGLRGFRFLLCIPYGLFCFATLET